MTRNVDKITRTAREMTEAQRDSYEALSANLASAQRRGLRLSREGMEFLRLQQENAKAAERWLAASMSVARLQQRNVRFAQEWLREGAEALREQTEHNVRTAETFARSARKQQEGLRALTQGWSDASAGFFFSPLFSPLEYAQEGLETLQQVTEEGTEATEEVARQGLRVAEEATERTEEVLRKTEEVTREAELRATVLSAVGTENYEGLTVAGVTEKLEGLTVEELEAVRELEKRTKDRESLLERIDSKIRASS